MTTDAPAHARWTARVAVAVDVVGALACAFTCVFFVLEYVDYSRIENPELYGFEIGMSFGISGLCGLLAVVLALAAWRRTRYAHGFAAASWVLACLPVSGVLLEVLDPRETGAVALMGAVLVIGVFSNVLAARGGIVERDPATTAP